MMVNGPVWLSDTRTPTCRNGHPWVSFRQNETKMVLETRGDCLHILTCRKCGGHALGVQSAGHEVIQWYEMDREQMDAVLAMPHSVKTWVILVYLGYMKESQPPEREAAA